MCFTNFSLKIVKHMKFKVAKTLLYSFFTYCTLLLCILIYPTSTLFTIQYKYNIYIYIYICTVSTRSWVRIPLGSTFYMESRNLSSIYICIYIHIYIYVYIYIHYNSICFITKALNIIHKQ